MKIVWVDFETRSRCDLLTRGAYNYSLDRSTEVLCMCYAFGDDEVQTWLPGMPVPDFTGYQIRAHNAAFERLIFWHVMELDYPLESFYCTAAQARANCLPGSLEDIGRALSSKMRKDHRGSQLIRLLSIPQADGTFNNDRKLMQEMIDYCVQDVKTMREVSKAMRQLSADELRDYHVSERINDRGVLVDVNLCRSAVRYASDEVDEIHQIIREVTGGELTGARGTKVTSWVFDRLGPQAQKLMEVWKDGEKKRSLDKAVRANLLNFAEENPDEVPEDVAEVIACSDDINASAVAKFSRFANLADEEDQRVRGAFVFAGGSATGRYSSFGVQVHNLPRKAAKNADEIAAAMGRGHSIVPQYGKRVTDVLKGMLRPALIPKPGHVFVVADWSAIEGRVNPWLAKSDHGEAKLYVFRAKRDPYIVNASATYRVPYEEVTPDQRQIGKVQELALGFSGGIGAFASMGKIYGVVIPDSEAQKMVNGWRAANPWAMTWWTAIENAYLRAMRNKGVEFSAGRVTYLYDGVHLWYALPSSRVLCYPFARFEEDGSISYLKAAWKPAADAKEWPRGRLWRGLACENVTQATANDLLRNVLREFSEWVVLHCHDEILLEIPEAEAQAFGVELNNAMSTPPDWATGLPLATEWKVLQRYGK